MVSPGFVCINARRMRSRLTNNLCALLTTSTLARTISPPLRFFYANAIFPKHQFPFYDVILCLYPLYVLNDRLTVFRVDEIRNVFHRALYNLAVNAL
jgi:hypothetical protein